MDISSDDDTPLVSIPNGKPRSARQNGKADSRNANGKRLLDPSSDLSDDDRPLVRLWLFMHFMNDSSSLFNRLKELRAHRIRLPSAVPQPRHQLRWKKATTMLP